MGKNYSRWLTFSFRVSKYYLQYVLKMFIHTKVWYRWLEREKKDLSLIKKKKLRLSIMGGQSWLKPSIFSKACFKGKRRSEF